MSTLTALTGSTFRLSSFQLKLIGILLMVFDHIHQFFPNDVPIWFTWIGRIVAPIFLFASAEGYYYTRSKWKYMLHLYIGYVLMSIMSMIIQRQLPSEHMLINNIFGTLFLAVLYMFVIDWFINSIKARKYVQMGAAIIAFILPIVLSQVAMQFITSSAIGNPVLFNLFIYGNLLIPVPTLVEGGYVFIILGVLFHLLRYKRSWQVLALVAVSVFIAWMSHFELLAQFQWMMVFAATPIALYNGTKGRNMKYLFYVFYPAHIYFLYVLAYLLGK